MHKNDKRKVSEWTDILIKVNTCFPIQRKSFSFWLSPWWLKKPSVTEGKRKSFISLEQKKGTETWEATTQTNTLAKLQGTKKTNGNQSKTIIKGHHSPPPKKKPNKNLVYVTSHSEHIHTHKTWKPTRTWAKKDVFTSYESASWTQPGTQNWHISKHQETNLNKLPLCSLVLFIVSFLLIGAR